MELFLICCASSRTRVWKDVEGGLSVLTARHEDGFCLWPTKTTDYSLTHSPYQNGSGDVVREFVAACRKYGLKPGFYHTATFDAHHALKPAAGETAGELARDQQKYVELQVGQVTELLSNYGPIAYLWFDHWNGANAAFRAVTDTARRLQPHCVILGPGYLGDRDRVRLCGVSGVECGEHD